MHYVGKCSCWIPQIKLGPSTSPSTCPTQFQPYSCDSRNSTYTIMTNTLYIQGAFQYIFHFCMNCLIHSHCNFVVVSTSEAFWLWAQFFAPCLYFKDLWICSSPNAESINLRSVAKMIWGETCGSSVSIISSSVSILRSVRRFYK